MDWNSIIIAVIAFVGTLCGSYFSNSKTIALLEYRLKALEDKVSKHNNVVERMALVERDIKEIKSHENI